MNVGPISAQLDRINIGSVRVPSSLFIIGSDPYGNYFALDLTGDRRGSVLFVDHEALREPPSSMTRVAVSFTALLDRAGSGVVTRPPPASVEEALASRDADGLRSLLTRGDSARGFVHRAMATRHRDMVREVLQHGGDANERGGIGGSETPLFIAARGGMADIAALLLDHGADPNARCSADGTALEMAEPWPEVVEVLARAGAVPTNPRLRAAVRRILGHD